MDKIICIIGESGSGKDTIADLLAARLNWNKIKSYTTREPRYEGEDTHMFIDNYKVHKGYRNLVNWLDLIEDIDRDKMYFRNEDMVAYEELYGEHYFMTYDQYKNKGTSIYVTSPLGAEQTKANADCDVVTVYLQADERERYKRVMYRLISNSDDIEEGRKYLIKRDMFSYKYGNDEIIDSMIDSSNKRIKLDRDIFHTINQVDHVIAANDDIETVYERVKEAIE